MDHVSHPGGWKILFVLLIFQNRGVMHKNPALLEKPGRFCEPESLYGKDCLGIGVVATFKVDILSSRTQHSQVCALYFQSVSVTHFSHLSGLWSHLNLWLLRFLFVLSFSGIHGSGTEWCVLWKGDRIHLCKYWALVLIISTSFILSRTFSPSQIVWACWPTHHSYSQRITHCVLCLPVAWGRNVGREMSVCGQPCPKAWTWLWSEMFTGPFQGSLSKQEGVHLFPGGGRPIFDLHVIFPAQLCAWRLFWQP